MVDPKTVEKQLKRLRFNPHGWGRSEVRELPNILLPDEEIFELANGIYEGGFAMLVATDVRVLLVDKKPMNYLTVEDLRFDMINEIDYSHRLIGAHISIATGSRNLRFRSYNQPRLRKLISHVQHRMADVKKQQDHHQVDQKQHLEQINQQLQSYLISQHQYQQEMQKWLQGNNNHQGPPPEPARPSPELSDYLFAQSLLNQYKTEHPEAPVQPQILPGMEQLTNPTQVMPMAVSQASPRAEPNQQPVQPPPTAASQAADLYAEGVQEIFGKHQPTVDNPKAAVPKQPATGLNMGNVHIPLNPLEINPLRIAYSKLPMALRNRKFGRPSFHAHSQTEPEVPAPTAAPAQY